MNDEETIDTTATLSRDDRKLIQRVIRLLFMFMIPALFARARREGYTLAEHRLGWRLVAILGGGDDSANDIEIKAQIVQGTTDAQEAVQSILQEIDAFENVWFPRSQGILRRAVPAERRDAFEAAFFDGIEQQPLGPGVIGSVGAFVGRIEALATSKDPDAKRFHKMLSARGLTTERLEGVRKLLARAELAGASGAPGPEVISTVNATRAERLKAMAELRDWYFDWAGTLRPAFNGRDQIKLGLTPAKPKKKKKAKGGGEEGGPIV